MRALGIPVLLIVLVGCDGPSGPASEDAGPMDAGDASVGPPCARDSDCSDGIYCNGEESCRPGEEGADGRGCVRLDPPCGVGACIESQRRCSDCAPEVADADLDFHDSIACGGDDCDDTRPDVHPGQPEVCDADGVDEDCNPLTWGLDADGDGAFAPSCCQRMAGELRCGTDCNDGDAAIGPHAAERCNGIDDDCDGAIDEDFECVQSQTATGTNACGRTGTRTCTETCTWREDGFYRAESASSCDYCDDSGMGLGEEIPFATEMYSLATEDGTELAMHGSAVRLSARYPSVAPS